jgi:hypothetical protein
MVVKEQSKRREHAPPGKERRGALAPPRAAVAWCWPRETLLQPYPEPDELLDLLVSVTLAVAFLSNTGGGGSRPDTYLYS